MKKLFLLLLTAITTSLTLLGQTIAPVESTEFCPLVNRTFTVTLPLIKAGSTVTLSAIGTPTIVTGVTGLTSNASSTTFTFVGRFSDDNNTQSFRVDYTKSNNTADFKIFDFKKIKSLKFYSSPSAINTNISSISSQICQITTHNINFTNTRFGNGFDGTVPAYGNSITQYEYLLPVGWKLGTTTSSGAWILANNSVTITSDLTSGIGSSVQIRALNTDCGVTLSKSPIRSVPITRPDPPLAISGATQLCFPNSYTYNLTGVPSGAVVTWQPSSYYSSTPSGNNVTISPTSAANGGTNVTASVFLPTCGLTFTKSFSLSIGTPYVTFSINSYPQPEPNCYEVGGIYSFQVQQITGYPNTYSNTQWGWRNLTLGTSYTDPTIYGLSYTFFPYDAGQYELWVKPTNSCGVGSLESVKNIAVVEACSGGPFGRMKASTVNVFPNPTTSSIRVDIPKEYQASSSLTVTNQMGIIVLTRNLKNSNAFVDLNLSNLKEGIYQIRLSTGNNSIQGKIIKQ
jgi:hypothetical protein